MRSRSPSRPKDEPPHLYDLPDLSGLTGLQHRGEGGFELLLLGHVQLGELLGPERRAGQRLAQDGVHRRRLEPLEEHERVSVGGRSGS